MSDVSIALMALNFLWQVGLTLFVFARRPGEDAARAGKALSDRLELLDSKVRVIEAHMEHMPSNDELAGLRGEMLQTQAMMEALREGMKSLRSTVELIDAHLRQMR